MSHRISTNGSAGLLKTRSMNARADQQTFRIWLKATSNKISFVAST
jgi:hypothetical protein